MTGYVGCAGWWGQAECVFDAARTSGDRVVGVGFRLAAVDDLGHVTVRFIDGTTAEYDTAEIVADGVLKVGKIQITRSAAGSRELEETYFSPRGWMWVQPSAKRTIHEPHLRHT